MADSLFDQNTDTELQLDAEKDYFSELVGEGKKYKNQNELAKANLHGTNAIEILKRRMDELRTDFTKERETSLAQTSLQELNNKMEALQASLNARQPQAEDEKLGIRPDEFKSLFSTEYKQLEQERKESANIQMVQNKLKEKYGNNYAQLLREKSNSLGLDDNFVETLAKKSPDAFFNTLGLNQSQSNDNFQAPPRSSMRTDFAPNAGKRTYAYYEDLRKKNPNAYYDPKIANQMMDDAFRYGEAFYD